MINVYIRVDENGKIISCDTNDIGGTIPVEIDEELFNSTKILHCYYTDGEVVFNEKSYEEEYNAVEEQKSIDKARKKIEDIQFNNTLCSLDDAVAYEVKCLYPKWMGDSVTYRQGDRVLFEDNLYKCKQTHTSENGIFRTPDRLPALWDLINPDDNKGTVDNPILIPENFSSMIYVKGKYYLEDNVLYLMNRQGMEVGQEISLTFKPSQLVGLYFEIVE